MFKKLTVMTIILATTHNTFTTPRWIHPLQMAIRAALTVPMQKEVHQKAYYAIHTQKVDVAAINAGARLKIQAIKNNFFREWVLAESARVEINNQQWAALRVRLDQAMRNRGVGNLTTTQTIQSGLGSQSRD